LVELEAKLNSESQQALQSCGNLYLARTGVSTTSTPSIMASLRYWSVLKAKQVRRY